MCYVCGTLVGCNAVLASVAFFEQDGELSLSFGAGVRSSVVAELCARVFSGGRQF